MSNTDELTQIHSKAVNVLLERKREFEAYLLRGMLQAFKIDNSKVTPPNSECLK